MRDMGVEVGEGWTYIADDFVGFVVDGDGLAEDCRAQHICFAGTIPDIMVFFCCNKPCLRSPACQMVGTASACSMCSKTWRLELEVEVVLDGQRDGVATRHTRAAR